MIHQDFVIVGVNGRVFISDETNSRDYITLLQYSGLTDINGKEIYEGDIVYVKSNVSKNADMDDIGQNKIVWNDGGLFLEGYSNDLGWQCDNFDIEILGNIYENPELLTP